MTEVMDKVGPMDGCDFSQDMLDKGAAKFEGRDNIKLQAADCCKLPYADNTFDSVMCNQVMQHVDQDTENRPNMKAR